MFCPINTKELCKLLRADGKNGSVVWKRENGQHFITNRHYLVRFDDLPKEVLITLFSIFCKVAEVGETLHAMGGDVIDVKKPIDFSKVYLPKIATLIGSKTQYIRDMGDKLFASVIKFHHHVSLVNEKYIKLANDVELIKGSDSHHGPLYLANDDLMVLPYQTTENQDFIIDLIESDKSA